MAGQLLHDGNQVLVGLERHLLELTEVFRVAGLQVPLETVADELPVHSQAVGGELNRFEYRLFDGLTDSQHEVGDVLGPHGIPVVLNPGLDDEAEADRPVVRVKPLNFVCRVALEKQPEQLDSCLGRKEFIACELCERLFFLWI